MNKQEVISFSLQFLEQKLSLMHTNQKGLMLDLESESKNSAGDKHETGRAMLQLEIEKCGKQIREFENMYEHLRRISPDSKHTTISNGALVETDPAVFFIAVSLGKIEISGRTVYCISPESPMAKSLSGAKISDHISFQGKKFLIKSIQ